jgi:hypothetical protein
VRPSNNVTTARASSGARIDGTVASMRTAIIAGCLLAACGSKEGRRGGPSCEERAARLERRLAVLAAEPAALIVVPDGLAPIESPRGEPIRAAGLVVTIRRDGALELSGEPVEGPDVLRDRLALAVEPARWDGADATYVLADRAAPASAVAAVLAAGPPGLTARLVVRGPAPPAEPHDETLRELSSVVTFDATMEGTDPSERAVELARAMETIVARCPPIIEVFGAVAGVEDKGAMIARGTPPAMRACKCRLTDPDLFEYILLRLFGAFDAPMRSLPLEGVPADARTAADLVDGA